MLFFGTFVSGLHEVVEDVLAAHGVRKVRLLLDGAVLYESARPLHLGCFNNTFEVIHHAKSHGRETLDAFIAAVLRQRRLDMAAKRSKRNLSFRIVTSQENKLVSVDAGKRAALERAIALQTGLRVNRAKADTEYWVLSRREGYMFFMKRISKGAPDDRLEKGALRPELAFLLNWLSRPERTDVFLDPFAGSGAIPFSRARMAGFRQMYVFDKQKEMVAALRGKAAALGEKKQAVVIEAVEVAGLPNALPGQCVDKIVTDPPWGYYEDVDVAALYQRMLRAFRAVTRPGARIVVLSAQKEIMERTVREHADVFEAVCVYHILVSGKKAGVFVLTRGAS